MIPVNAYACATLWLQAFKPRRSAEPHQRPLLGRAEQRIAIAGEAQSRAYGRDMRLATAVKGRLQQLRREETCSVRGTPLCSASRTNQSASLAYTSLRNSDMLALSLIVSASMASLVLATPARLPGGASLSGRVLAKRDVSCRSVSFAMTLLELTSPSRWFDRQAKRSC